METKNNVIIKGKIVNKYITPKNNHIILTIKTYKHNFPKVFFPRKDTFTVADSYQIGDEVTIIGNLQSTKREDRFSCCVFGTAIGLSPNDGNRKNLFELSGRIIKFKTEKNYYKLLVEVDGEYYSTVPVIFYRPEHNELQNYSVGDSIDIKGVIQTKKTINSIGEITHYENYVGFYCA